MRMLQQVIDTIKEAIIEELEATLYLSGLHWPPPQPPIIDDFGQPTAPDSIDTLLLQAKGLVEGGHISLERLVINTIEEMIHGLRIKGGELDEQHGRRVLRRIDEVTIRTLFGLTEDWLFRTLDPDAPDTSRWWLAFSLFTGLTLNNPIIASKQGYHLFESILLARPPGHWHGDKAVGPHQIGWTPSHTTTEDSLEASEGGIIASHWLLDILEGGDEEQQQTLTDWLLLILERPSLSLALDVSLRMERFITIAPTKLVRQLATGLPRLVEVDPAGAGLVASAFNQLGESEVRVAVASQLPRMVSLLGEGALSLIDVALADDDEEVVISAITALRFLSIGSGDKFITRAAKLIRDERVEVRKTLALILDSYLKHDPSDHLSITSTLLSDPNENVRELVRKCLYGLEGGLPDRFAMLVHGCGDEWKGNLDDFWLQLQESKPQRYDEWMMHFEGDGPLPIMSGKNTVAPATDADLLLLSETLTRVRGLNDREEE